MPASRLPRQSWQEREEAEVKAYRTLLSCLSPSQAQEMKSLGCFTVTSSSGCLFQIRTDSTIANVRLIQSGPGVKRTAGETYCAIPKGLLPLADVILSQKLVLEADDSLFFRVANVFGANGWRIRSGEPAGGIGGVRNWLRGLFPFTTA